MKIRMVICLITLAIISVSAVAQETTKKGDATKNETTTKKKNKSDKKSIKDKKTQPEKDQPNEGGNEIKEEQEKLEDAVKKNEEKINALYEKLNKRKTVYFGLSIGYRQAFSIGKADKFLANATISPIDSTLQVELDNRYTFLVSALFSAFPFEEKPVWYRDIGFYANINLAEIASDGNFESIFNRQIEGGIGLAKRLNEDFSVALGYEYVFHRRVRDYVFDYRNQQLTVDGVVATQLDKNDDRLFRNDNVHAWSLKFVYFF